MSIATQTSQKLAIDGGTPVRSKPLQWELPGAHFLGAEEVAAAKRAIVSRSLFRYYGPDLQNYVDRLEASYRERLSHKHALALASGTAALYCALGALEVGPGDEVLVPAYHWCSCISAIVRHGAIPRLADIDETFCVDPKDLAKKIGPRSKALLLVHMSGAPGDLDAIFSVCREKKIPIIEDCAQANGAKYKGKPVGSLGDLAIFSFQLNKNMTSGEGGMLVCNDEQHYKRAFAIHDMGFARDENGRLDVSDTQHQVWGTGARMSELTAAVALEQHKKLGTIVRTMHNVKWKIRAALAELKGVRFRHIVDPDGDSSPFLITIYETPAQAERFTAALQAEGIAGPTGSAACIPMTKWGLHFYFNNQSLVLKRPLTKTGWPWTDPNNAFAKDYSYASGACPTCDDLAKRSAILAISSCLEQGDAEDIIAAFRKVAASLT